MRAWVIKGFLATVLLSGVCGCSEDFTGFETLRPGTYEHNLNLRVYGFRRSYLLHIPKGYDHTAALPLVVALHGGFGTARQMEEESGLSKLADREGFIVLYPNGVGFWGWLQHWNAGHCCGQAMKDGIDDVGFVSTILDQVCQHLKVDLSRIYIVGYSNGGMLAHLFAAKRPETIAAAATIAATIGSRPSASEAEIRIPPAKGPVHIIAFYGREDDVIPYEKGGSEKGRHLYVPVKESMAFWIMTNQCSFIPQREEMRSGSILKKTWTGDNPGRKVVLYTLKGWKHGLPTLDHTRKLTETDPLGILQKASSLTKVTTCPFPSACLTG